MASKTCLLVRDRPRSSSSDVSVSPGPGRDLIAFAQLMISSLLLDDADEAIMAATGLCECFLEPVLGRVTARGLSESTAMELNSAGRDGLTTR